MEIVTVSFLSPSFLYTSKTIDRFCGNTFFFRGDDKETGELCQIQIILVNEKFVKYGPKFISKCESLLGKQHPNVAQVLEVRLLKLAPSDFQELMERNWEFKESLNIYEINFWQF